MAKVLRVPFLVGELKSHRPHGAIQKKKKKKDFKEPFWANETMFTGYNHISSCIDLKNL